MTFNDKLTILAALNFYQNACEASIVNNPNHADYYKSELGLIDVAKKAVEEDYEAQCN